MSGWIFLPHLTQGELVGHFIAHHKDWRLMSLALYGTPNEPRYAAIWLPSDGRVQALALDMYSGADIVLERERMREDGFQPVLITATGSFQASEPHRQRYALVYEERSYDGQDPRLVFGQERDPFEDIVFHRMGSSTGEPRTANPWFVRSFDVHAVPRQVHGRGLDSGFRFSAVLHPQPVEDPLAWHLHLQNTNDFNTLTGWTDDPGHRAARRGWARAEMVVPIASQRVAIPFRPPDQKRALMTLWRGDTYAPWPADMLAPSYTGGVDVFGPMTLSAVGALSQLLDAEGRRPHTIGANGVGDDARFVLTTAPANRRRPLARLLEVRDGAQRGQDRVPPSALVSSGRRDSASGAPRYRVVGKRSLSEGRTGSWPDGPGPQLPPPRPRAGGGPGGGGPPGPQGPGQPGPDLSYAGRLKRLDADVRSILTTTGARAMQYAVAYNGKLVLARSYTLAEPNYPVLTNTHMMRIGSISKPLTATAIVGAFAPNGDLSELQTPLTEAGLLDVKQTSPNYQNLHTSTLEDLIRHQSGWGDDYSFGGRVGGQKRTGTDFWEYGSALAAGRDQLPAEPGDTIQFIRSYDDTIFQNAPNERLDYHGITYRVLGELFGKKRALNWSQHVLAVQEWCGLGANRDERARTGRRLQDDAVNGNEFYCHSAHPLWSTAHPANGPAAGLLAPNQYAANHPWSGGAGGWVMTASTLVRICQGMSRMPGLPQLLTDAQLDLIVAPPPPDTKGYPALGWHAHRSVYADEPMVRIEFEGALNGCRAAVVHRFADRTQPTAPGQPRKHHAISLAILLNQDAPNGWDFSPLSAWPGATLELSGFPDVDLFPTLV